MRKSRLLVVGVLAAALSGCWPAPGAGPDRRNWNPYERIVTPGNAGRLTERFRIPLTDGTGPPVVTPSGLFVRTGPSIAAFAAGTGEHRWTARVLPDDTGPYEPETGDPFVVDSRGEVLASYAVFGASHTRHNFLATLSAGTGARQETYLPGQLHAMRGSAVAVVHHEQCCFGEVDYTRIHVGDPSDICPECKAEQAKKWQPIGTLKAIGACLCRTGCHCHFEYKGGTS